MFSSAVKELKVALLKKKLKFPVLVVTILTLTFYFTLTALVNLISGKPTKHTLPVQQHLATKETDISIRSWWTTKTKLKGE